MHSPSVSAAAKLLIRIGSHGLVTADVILPPGCCRKAEVEKRGPIHHSLIHSGSM